MLILGIFAIINKPGFCYILKYILKALEMGLQNICFALSPHFRSSEKCKPTQHFDMAFGNQPTQCKVVFRIRKGRGKSE